MTTRAHRHILWYITQFCITHVYQHTDGPRVHGSLHGFYTARNDALVGDLVIPTSSPISEWYLSWLKEIRQEQYGYQYLLESVETGKECWWSNIGLEYMDRKVLAEFPEWKWSDKQYEFADRWYKNIDHNPVPCKPVFHGHSSV